MTYKHVFPHPANDLHKYTPDHLLSVLSRNYWETQGAIWDPVRRELTHIPVYFRICLFRVECSGCTSWQSREKGGRREGRGRGRETSSEPPRSTVYCLFYGDCIRLPSYCQVDKRRKKINQKPNQINVQLINSAAKNLPLRDGNNAPWKPPPSCPHKGDDK